jgi:hypothetical protein
MSLSDRETAEGFAGGTSPAVATLDYPINSVELIPQGVCWGTRAEDTTPAASTDRQPS